MSKAMMAMRDIAVKMALFYYKYIPGFQNSYLERTAQFVGVRDSRRIIGDYMLTQEDVLTGRAFDDGISRYGSIIDIHSTERAGNYVFKEVGGSGWFHIPYAIMLPKGLENIIAAGRFVSADDWAQGATRSQGSCMLTGQAAGTAAAIAAKEGVTPRGIDIKKLQKTLISQNVLI
jgi:hypothetical protein